MARKKNEVTVIESSEFPEAVVTRVEAAQNAAVAQYDRALVLAKELGYQGALTVDALEVEIRFYQRRTVESLLEVGRCLLVLKELTPHGEFTQRVEGMGFSYRTAHRFMQAAVKTSKSATVAVLAKEMKSSKAFLELVTHDDDADLEKLAELDEIERMSASQVRAKLRELQAEREATQKLLDGKNQKMDRLEAELQKALKPASIAHLPELPPPDVRRQELCAAATGEALGIEQSVRLTLHAAIAELLAHGEQHGGNGGRNGGTAIAAACVMQVQQALNDVRDDFELPKFQDYVPDWYEAFRKEAGDADEAAAPVAADEMDLYEMAEEVDPKTFNA